MTSGFLVRQDAQQLALRIAGAVFGFALVLSLESGFERAAPPDQLPGYMTWVHLDAHGPFRFFAALMIAPVICAWASRLVARLLRGPGVERWSVNLILFGSLTSLWIGAFVSDWRCAALPTGIAVIVALLFRRVRASFTRRDLILLPTMIPVFFAALDMTKRLSWVALLVLSAALVLLIRLLLSMLARQTSLPPALCFAASPLAIACQTVLSSRHARHLAFPPLLLAVGVPFLIFLFVPGSMKNRRRLSILVPWVVYPVFVFCHQLAASAWTAEGMQRSDIFETSHSLLPASEMLRGERPYRDIIPGHGLLEDGLLDYAVLRIHGRNLGDARNVHSLAGDLNSIAIYAVGWAATGSPEAGVVSFLLARALLASGTIFLRSAPALFSLALTIAAARLRRRRLLFRAGVVGGLGAFVAVEFAVYSLAVLAVGALRQGTDWRERFRTFGLAAAGVAAGVLLPMTIMAFGGIAVDFVRVTLTEVLSLGPVYNIGFFTAPATLKTFRFVPEAAVGLFSLDSISYVAWLLALLLTAIGLTQHGFRSTRRSEPLFLISLFSVLCAVSYAERHHIYNQFVVSALLITIAWRAFRSRIPTIRAAAPLVVAGIVMAAHLTPHLSVMAMVRITSGPLDRDLVTIDDIPRARGVWFKQADVRRIESVGNFVNANLGPDETFFDFTNRGLTYYLFNRDCPIRQYEVPYYESPERQAEVIRRLEANHLVRAAMVPDGLTDATAIDGIPMQLRAPLVWQYLQSHFEPAFHEGDVVFLRRK